MSSSRLCQSVSVFSFFQSGTMSTSCHTIDVSFNTSMSLLKKLTTHLRCLQVQRYSSFIYDSATDSGLSVFDLPSICEKVRMYDRKSKDILEELCVSNQRFVFKS